MENKICINADTCGAYKETDCGRINNYGICKYIYSENYEKPCVGAMRCEHYIKYEKHTLTKSEKKYYVLGYNKSRDIIYNNLILNFSEIDKNKLYNVLYGDV